MLQEQDLCIADWTHQWRKARASLRVLPSGPRNGILRYWQQGPLPGDPTYLLGLIHDPKARKRPVFGTLLRICADSN
jgi:hypothetical protein